MRTDYEGQTGYRFAKKGLKVCSADADGPDVNGIDASRLTSMASKGDDLNVVMLKKALEGGESQMAQLMASLPQKANAGSLVDVQL